ncbi:zinc finger domain-containing protein [Hirsutella rhossiliensis]|uniref:Zinc finger domain-containing protein n=1 Tax=Hirsutella rhossiliensis TaxID=111463 RepID=A0A9P8MWH7_9HYPO|nr:zinc finger domain-containing protein [Hirsutella rhossiliensis]KAH0962469.1 zinc finger domain-containing protein [Hirsutella rhossiliensis]
MTAISRTLGEAAILVARATGSLSESPSPSTTSTSVQSPQSSSPAGTNQSNDNSNNQSGGSSSPLLFFVALGFGVVFTNLWIIVGVKYCFRYNARNRARMNNEDGEPITLETVQRPHRRRREKKLMSMDEVNDKFPMMKYKTWVLERAREGLPTAGGVTVSASQANSIREADGIVPVISAKEPPSVDGPRPSDATANPAQPETAEAEANGDAEKTKPNSEQAANAGQTSVSREAAAQGLQRVPSDEDVDDEHIDAALPPECLGTPGDTCAICIDSLEDDDDADYYTPKPRPNPEGETTTTTNSATVDSHRNSRVNLPSRLRAAWLRTSNPEATRHPVHSNPRPRRANRTRNIGRGRQGSLETPSPRHHAVPTTATQSSGGGLLSSVRQALRFGRRNNEQPAGHGTSDTVGSGPVTPSQLEAGNQPSAAPATTRATAQ